MSKKIKCKICGTPTSNQVYCSRKCSSDDPERKEKRKQTCLKKYGVENPFQNKSVQEKRKQTCLKKYGVENSSQDKNVLEKQKQTNLKKYGVEHPLQNKSVQEKQKQTMIERYDVRHPIQNKTIQEKTKQTILKRYGVEHQFASKQIQEKIKQVLLERYGVEHPIQNKEIQEKQKQTNLKKYGVEHPLQNEYIKQKTKQTNLKRYRVENSRQKHNLSAFKLLSNYGWLYDQYVNQLKSSIQIGFELNVDKMTVCRYLTLYDIPFHRITNFSCAAVQWLEHISQQKDVFIQHAGNIGEYNIPGTRYYVDGYCDETNTIYEFHGDMWHGNPNLYKPEEHCHPFNPEITAGELYQRTLQRENEIKQMGYNLVVMWENGWKLMREQYE